MSKRTCITTPDSPPPIGPYCQGNVAGPFVYTSETGGDTPKGVLPKTVEEQTDQAISNIAAILEAGGCELSDVCKVTVYLTDLKNFQAMNGVYAKRFKQPYPARSIIQSPLPAPGAFVAIEAIALRPGGKDE